MYKLLPYLLITNAKIFALICSNNMKKKSHNKEFILVFVSLIIIFCILAFCKDEQELSELPELN